jgi:general secretion pathway protein G
MEWNDRKLVLVGQLNTNDHRHPNGFTIVELLIVIVVIGILAAISIVAYNGIQNRGYDTSVQSDLTNIAKKMHSEGVLNGDTYPMPTASMGIKVAKSAYSTLQNTLYYCKNDSTHQFALSARSRSGKTYKYTSDSTVTENATAMYGADTCALIGQAAWSGTYGSVGYDQVNNIWAAWAN